MAKSNGEFKVRKLRAGDVKTVIKIVGSELSTLREINAKGEDADPEEVGMIMLNRLVDKHLDEVWEWLASMAEMSVEEFDKQPADAPVRVIEAIREDDEFRPLLNRLAQLIPSEDGDQSATESPSGTAGRTLI